MSKRVCRTAKELSRAVKDDAGTIIIEGSLKDKVIRIKATGSVAWGACASALIIAISIIVTAPARVAATAVAPPVGSMALTHTFVALPATAPAFTILGNAAALTAIKIGVFFGGIGALTSIRDKYEIVEKNNKYIKLEKKHKKHKRQ